MSYPYVLLGDYIDILSGFAFKSKDFSENGIPVIKIKNIVPPYVTLEDLSYVPNEIAKSNQKYLLTYNDVLIALTGSHINQMASVVGRIARVKYNIPSLLNQRVGKITVKNEGSCDINYVYYFLSQEQIKIALASKAGGAANQANISPSDIKKLIIPLPPIEIQRRIADILSAYDDLFENNRKQIKLLEEAAQRLYKEWFVDLHFPGHEHTKIVDGVPEGWKKSAVLDVSSVLRRGISPKYNDQANLTVINQKCIRQTVVTFDEARKQEKTYPDAMNLQDSDTVICSTGAGTLGRVGQIFGNHPQTTFDSHVTLVRAKSGFGKQYLFHCLKSYQSYFMGMGKGSTNQLELSRGTIQDLDILIPSEALGKRFEVSVQSIHDKINTVNSQIEHLTNARDRLLPKLMSGEEEV